MTTIFDSEEAQYLDPFLARGLGVSSEVEAYQREARVPPRNKSAAVLQLFYSASAPTLIKMERLGQCSSP